MQNPITIGNTTTVAATTTSSTTRVALSKGSISQQLLITSPAGGAVAFLNFGDSTVAAAVASSFPVLPGSAQIVTVGPNVTHVAGMTGATSATVYVTSGHVY